MLANDNNKIVGQNIRLFRKELGLTQDALAEYLQTTREQVSYYENGTRTTPTIQLSKLADLFCVNDFAFFESDPDKRKTNIAFAFRADALEATDLSAIAKFKKVVRNYLNMKETLSHV